MKRNDSETEENNMSTPQNTNSAPSDDNKSKNLTTSSPSRLHIFGGVLAIEHSQERLKAIKKLHTCFGTPEKFDAFIRSVTIQRRLIEIEESIAKTISQTTEDGTSVSVGATEHIRKQKRKELKTEKLELIGELGQLRIMNIIEDLDELLETILKALNTHQLRRKLDILSEERYTADFQSVPEEVRTFILEKFPRRDFQGTVERFFSLVPIEEALIHFLHYVSLSGAVSLEESTENDPFFSALSANPGELRQHISKVLFSVVDGHSDSPTT